MAIDIVLANFTEQGIKGIKDSPQRARAFRELAKKHGVTVRELYWTVGRYDLVTIVEGTDEAITAVLRSVAKLGNVRTETLRGMDEEAFKRVLEKVG